MPRDDQTEKATPKRRGEVRQRGQVARSPDLSSAAVFLSLVIVLHLYFTRAINAFGSLFRLQVGAAAHLADPTVSSVWRLFLEAGMLLAPLLLMVAGVAVVVGIVANVAQIGLLFSAQILVPQISRINPLAGFQRLFSRQVAVNLVKQGLKLVAVGVLVWTSLYGQVDRFAELGAMSPRETLGFIEGVAYGIGWRFGILLLLLGFADYAYQRWEFERNIMMTKQEVKDEARQSEGDPMVKARVRQKMRESSRRRMMAAVPKATVVVTNPTHFAVALMWDEIKMDAPVVSAKGADLLAKRIREIAAEHGVPVMENPPLARQLYDKVPLDQPIPPNLYTAVAEVIAFVYKLKHRTIA
ncbi:MAG TPA: flagellar biosynthesis protein FlhB [Candidatus Dormibacteraeota bacterium]|nr:flagellar biosynthesis protein FlhB [Candidatus Dormibacteraeota bacterium]